MAAAKRTQGGRGGGGGDDGVQDDGEGEDPTMDVGAVAAKLWAVIRFDVAPHIMCLKPKATAFVALFQPLRASTCAGSRQRASAKESSLTVVRLQPS